MMAIVDALLPEYDHEMAVTRKVLERVAEGKFGWQPHAKSMTLGRLAMHVADIQSWGHTILSEPEFDMVDGERQPKSAATVADLLAVFDGHVSAIRPLLAGKSDADLMTTWTFKHNGQQVFVMPRATAWRSFVMSHLIHHRGQLSVYLRQTGSKVPGIYGPSADEG
jgi:uncharacterized damage-inducible protein DinB